VSIVKRRGDEGADETAEAERMDEGDSTFSFSTSRLLLLGTYISGDAAEAAARGRAVMQGKQMCIVLKNCLFRRFKGF
jgi:hypothetical protein